MVTPVPATPVPATPVARQPASGRLVLGYYVAYDASSWQSLLAHADQIDIVATQSLFVDRCGNLASQDDRTLRRFAQGRGLKVLPSVFTLDGEVNHRLLTDPATTDRIIRDLVAHVLAEEYDGLDVDLEGVPAGDRPFLTSFVRRLSTELRRQGKLLTMAVPAKAFDATTGWAGAYDYAALAPHVDLFTIMSYAYTTSTTPPGSTAPYDWVNRVATYVASVIPPQKVLLGVAFYGYDWNTSVGGRARALRYPHAAAIAGRYGAAIRLDPATRSGTFSYVARADDPPVPAPAVPAVNHEIQYRQPSCPGPSPTATPPPRPTPIPPAEQRHVVWLENAASVAARLELASRYAFGGIGAWRLGQEDDAVWTHLREFRGSVSR
ncbi:MAG: hypothetical protein HYY04_02650 [Chloroflexi bacterium]|nr:hypothetical protein [Chloroflexota bacterium]